MKVRFVGMDTGAGHAFALDVATLTVARFLASLARMPASGLLGIFAFCNSAMIRWFYAKENLP